jgi:hypothetical protein
MNENELSKPDTAQETGQRSLWRAGRMLGVTLALLALGLACNGLGFSPTDSPTDTAPTVEAAEAADASLALTVYNQGSALVRDRRQFDLSRGLNEIAFSDVAATIDATSVLFKSLTD